MGTKDRMQKNKVGTEKYRKHSKVRQGKSLAHRYTSPCLVERWDKATEFCGFCIWERRHYANSRDYNIWCGFPGHYGCCQGVSLQEYTTPTAVASLRGGSGVQSKRYATSLAQVPYSVGPATHCKEHRTPVQLLAKPLHLQEKGAISVDSAMSLILYQCNIHYVSLVQSDRQICCRWP